MKYIIVYHFLVSYYVLKDINPSQFLDYPAIVVVRLNIFYREWCLHHRYTTWHLRLCEHHDDDNMIHDATGDDGQIRSTPGTLSWIIVLGWCY